MKSTLMLGACALALPFGAGAAPESYTMDPYHTYPYFIVSHFGVGNTPRTSSTWPSSRA
jgi:polyisoprenoid-binding protein YceI